MSHGLTSFRCFVLPGWVHRALLRNKLNILDLMDYSKVRKVLSIDDLAEWFYLNDHLTVDKCKLSNTFLDFHFHSMTEQQRSEFSVSILPQSASEDVAASAKAKLDGSYPMNDSSYEFIYVDNILYVVLNEGFNKILEKPESLMEFVKEYLKKCYEYLPVNEVSKLPIYKLYLRQFSKQAIA